MVWNGTEISVWKMPEWNGRPSSILPYQFHTGTRFQGLHLQKNIANHILYGCRVVINNIVAEVFHFNNYAHYLWTNRDTLIVFIAQTVYALHHTG